MILESGVRIVAALFFFFNDTATTEIYTLSLHDALPISLAAKNFPAPGKSVWANSRKSRPASRFATRRSEEHTSELQSQSNLVCRLLLEKKKNRSCTASALEKVPASPALCTICTLTPIFV